MDKLTEQISKYLDRVIPQKSSPKRRPRRLPKIMIVRPLMERDIERDIVKFSGDNIVVPRVIFDAASEGSIFRTKIYHMDWDLDDTETRMFSASNTEHRHVPYNESSNHRNNTYKKVQYNMNENSASHSVFYREPNSFEFVLEQEFYIKFATHPSRRTWNTISSLEAKQAYDYVIREVLQILSVFQYDVTTKVAKFKHVDVVATTDTENQSFEETIILGNKSEKLAEVLVSVMLGYNGTIRVVTFCNDSNHKVVNFVLAEVDNLERFKKTNPPEAAMFNIITQDSSGLSLKEFQIAKLDNLDTFISDHYNDDFAAVSDIIIDKLNNGNKGIILLHGSPGTGKTNYIRYIANLVKNKRLIYIPPELTGILASPEFISFVMDHKNSIFIVEDAENVIKTREAGASSSVTNLLNMSDGIVGDAVQCQFVCTFNAEYDTIDSALRRKGRLNATYKFEGLNVEKAQKLIERIHSVPNYPIDKSMTLAEIYNLNDVDFGKIEEKRRIGF